MNSNEAVKTMLATVGMSQKELSAELGASEVSSNSKVSTLLRSPLKANTLARIADILGYDLILVKRRSAERIKIEYDPDIPKRSRK